MNDTIAAISTAVGEGGIGIVRISGPESYAIADRIFTSRKKNKDGFPQPRKLYHGYIKDRKGNIIDEVLVAFMPAPYTYTREDIVEINCHGGIFSQRSILKLVIENGARLAEPGEFTRRAFISGRIDLSQAEAVLSMIQARSEEAVKIAARSLQGELSGSIEKIREHIISIRAPLEASFDYPEEFDPLESPAGRLDKELGALRKELADLLKGAGRNRAYQEGVSVAIIGRPNVGKSSLLNALLRQQRAIVHEHPGTTRDLLEGYLFLGGYPLQLVDTAGIQGSIDPVEKQGIERSRRAAAQAGLLIVVIDASQTWTAADDEIISLHRPGQGLVIVLNKADLKQDRKTHLTAKTLKHAEIVKTAALKEKGIRHLEEALIRQLDSLLKPQVECAAVISLRQENLIRGALENIEHAESVVDYMPLELISLELQSAWDKLGIIIGERAGDDLLDKIFSEFCLGK